MYASVPTHMPASRVPRRYSGRFVKRHGWRRDGCATFWWVWSAGCTVGCSRLTHPRRIKTRVTLLHTPPNVPAMWDAGTQTAKNLFDAGPVP